MRRTAVVLLVLASLLISAMPASAGMPFPETRHAARALVRDSVDELDGTAAGAIGAARALLSQVRNGLPAMLMHNGELEVRAGFAQPVVRGQEDFLSLVWAGSGEDPWLGVYWIETPMGVRSPNLLQVEPDGAFLFLDAGITELPDSVDITYHFLGVDGKQIDHHVGVSQVLDFLPDAGRVDLGAAIATARGSEPEAIFFTPWNLLGADAIVGFTTYAGDEVLEEYLVVSCADFETTTMESGCRQLYIGLFSPELTSFALWHEEAGVRITDVELSRADLIAGYSFTP
ncbi:MAG TPA: hypothetical protein VM370_11625 [Candidatus Thermoplasmatota archaeon]|nr:hypothetical protein [Candidatus Thermoplasmatota archaeon]